MLSHTSTEWAPWYVIPADRKWYARIAAGAVIANALIEIDPRYPEVSQETRDGLQEIKATLEGQAPDGRRGRPVRGQEQATRTRRRAVVATATQREQPLVRLDRDGAGTRDRDSPRARVDTDSGLTAAEAAERARAATARTPSRPRSRSPAGAVPGRVHELHAADPASARRSSRSRSRNGARRSS